ncbi:MAG: deoxyribodipyrimidine photo-lyase [Bacteroidales bacterium]|jgi:deoxyribodipyrimidine photo-lyase|nr:deoxyribodipyrimidine photo-lyase [Bacteroidales bacterium]
MSQRDAITLFWFRRDLRLEDNTGLYHALKSGHPVLPVFIFDTEILDRLEEKADRRVAFIMAALGELNKKLIAAGSSLRILHGTPEAAFRKILGEYDVKAVFANRDYEPYATLRDNKVSLLLKATGIPFHSLKDQVIFEKNDVTKSDGTPYTVFTPYSRVWKKQLTPQATEASVPEKFTDRFIKMPPAVIPRPEEIGFSDITTISPVPVINTDIIRNYHLNRDIPSLEGTTRLGVHLRFGTVSIRGLVRTALDLNETWLNELIWREFFMCILWHFPHVTDNAFRSKYDAILWRNNEEEFARWCDGMTGYPIVDAGMRELNATGFMHNRVRMITASFLAKHLLIDWRWGEAYFAAKLLDYELSSNNGNWQWAAGTGCDAAPYFRIFNPAEQTRRYDPELVYVRRWVPEIDSPSYPGPVVDHATARQRALDTYSSGLGRVV